MKKETIEAILKIAIENGGQFITNLEGKTNTVGVFISGNRVYLKYENSLIKTGSMEISRDKLIRIITSRPFIDAFYKYIVKTMNEKGKNSPPAMIDMFYSPDIARKFRIFQADAIYNETLEDFFISLIK